MQPKRPRINPLILALALAAVLMVWSVLGGFLGSKILYLLTRLPDILANPALLGSSIKDGFVVYGGIIGGILIARKR